MEGPDPRPAPLTEPTGDATELPDWALVEPPDQDEPDWSEQEQVAEEPVEEPAESVEPEPVDPAPVAELEPVTPPEATEPVELAEPVVDVVPVDVEPVGAGRDGFVLPIALALALLVLLGAVGWLVSDARDSRSRDDARQAALQAARQEAVNLTTISYETADADLGRIIAAATGTLKTQFEAQRAQFPGVLAKDKSVSVGTVLAAGVASQSSSTVEALVAVDAAVSNAETAKAGSRPLVKHYRMDMKLVLVGGKWLVSQVAFAGLPQ